MLQFQAAWIHDRNDGVRSQSQHPDDDHYDSAHYDGGCCDDHVYDACGGACDGSF
ncbi:hypothetical protein [Photobacterium chitinilyticum]|uniref:hypothetical protein n=1 Tax=Photobacterium chitinilyticum TaxID=2485123 RepID=UPI0013E8E166|nr:hypothetical protein [Photobacterium chitinilyticum]